MATLEIQSTAQTQTGQRGGRTVSWPKVGIRAQLLLLILLPTVALVALTIGYQLRERSAEEQRLEDRVVSAASLAAQTRFQSSESTRSFMAQMSTNELLLDAAANPESPVARSACSARLAATAESLGPTVGFGLFDTRGDMICSSTSADRGFVNIADRSDFQAAIAKEDFAIGEVIDSKTEPVRPIAAASMPLYSDGRDVLAVMRIGVEIQEARPLLVPNDLPAGTEISVIDRYGRVMASSSAEPGTQLLAPDTVASLGLPEYLSTTQIDTERDGTEQRSFITRATDDASAPILAVLSVPPSALSIPLMDAFFPELGVVLGIAFVTIAGAWWLGEVLIARRTTTLTEAARRIRSGEFADGTLLEEDESDLGQVAYALNELTLQYNESITKLERALNTKDEFLGLVSHELRTPVTTILGNAQVLKTRWNTLHEDARTAALADMHDDSNRLRTIIENLLLVARLESEQPLEIEPIILRHTIQGLMDDRQRRHPDRAYELILPEELVVVDGNQHCIEQVMSNLLNNAEKYSPRGTPITVRLERRCDRMTASVEDRGIGVDGDAEELFTPFYRSRQASDVSGIGLGLTVCQRLVEAQGGRIWARPRPGGGSVFAFDLPVTKLDVDEAEAGKPPREPAVASRFAGEG